MSSLHSAVLSGIAAMALAATAAAQSAPGAHGIGDAEQARQLAEDAPPNAGQSAEVGHYGYGRVPTPVEIAGWAIAVQPDGTGLPDGHGSVSDGAEVFGTQCAACHGTFGEGEGRYPKLAGDAKLTDDQAVKTVGNFWPYATTLWDYVNRAMPFPAPHSLAPNDVYAITAYILNLNNLVPDDFVADRASLPKVRMPNRDGFLLRDPRPDTHDTACMQACRDPAEVKIAGTAEGKGVTPRTTGPLDEMQPK